LPESVNPGFIDECEREVLHRIGAIQPIGTLLGGRTGDPLLRFASANLAAWSGLEASAVLGQPISALVPWLNSEQVDEIAAFITSNDDEPAAARKTVLLPSLCSGPHGELDAVLSRGIHDWLLELQPALSAKQRQDAYRPIPHALFRVPRSQHDWDQLCRRLTASIRDASGFERVMVYQFRPDGCGEVIAESRADDLPPYLGLRYPASDIPQTARTLYMANRHRQIPDVRAEPVPVLSKDGSSADLTLSDLRAVSPVHVEYLRNMGVVASLSFPVSMGEELWGLIACHHRQMHSLPFPIRERCAEMASAFRLGIAGFHAQNRLAALSGSDRDTSRLIEGIAGLQSGALPVFPLQKSLLRLVGATGAALTENDPDGGGLDEILTFGKTPGPAQIRRQLEWLRSSTMEQVFATDELPALLPDSRGYAALASGLLAVRTSAFDQGTHRERIFLWWRPEQQRAVHWAGDPRKSAMFADQSSRLSPRSSFEAWVEISRGRSEPWTDMDLLNAKKFRSLVLRNVNAALFQD